MLFGCWGVDDEMNVNVSLAWLKSLKRIIFLSWRNIILPSLLSSLFPFLFNFPSMFHPRQDVPAMFEIRRFLMNQIRMNRIKFYANTESKLIFIPWKHSLQCGPCLPSIWAIGCILANTLRYSAMHMSILYWIGIRFVYYQTVEECQ